MSQPVQYCSNPGLPVLKPDWPGNGIRRGRFCNPGFDPPLPVAGFLRWRMSVNPQWREKRRDRARVLAQTRRPAPVSREEGIIWLGHAGFLVRMSGKSLLLDPCLFGPPFVRRYAPRLFGLHDLGRIDYLFVSHAHRDHLDIKTLRRLDPEKTRVMAPLGLGGIIRRANPGFKVEEAGWWQRFSTPEGLEVVLVPARHWSAWHGWDFNRSLWGGCLVRGTVNGEPRSVFFAGDTGHGPHFAETARLFPDIDTALLPVGAYKPAYVMRGHHLSPWEAVRAVGEIKARILIPMHHGTFDLSDEPAGEPLRALKELESQGRIPARLALPEPGGHVRP
jgi:L-ascorbate metabolism protein UlaG (beta-lactamase superfamily)